jgi:endonuclease/exonuclease/phosphatase family metal-dependent hydrolase
MRLVTYLERIQAAREAVAASGHPNGQPDAMTPEMAQLDRVYVSGAARRRNDSEIRRLRRQVSNRSAATAIEWDEEDGGE